MTVRTAMSTLIAMALIRSSKQLPDDLSHALTTTIPRMPSVSQNIFSAYHNVLPLTRNGRGR
ncbi:hypothetical protein DAEQUDRAFT_730906 [Daedalea quercina L-15889]|uniref:Uncharacterized protein n=1 Tax=Daedalea quercina L-15889 TaxID=1314783 RepID=A0A165MLU9_9APHY|nr:hypothetical protein DAEQUDRAFT_730906 [Daedalea quercina L-15889]